MVRGKHAAIAAAKQDREVAELRATLRDERAARSHAGHAQAVAERLQAAAVEETARLRQQIADETSDALLALEERYDDAVLRGRRLDARVDMAEDVLIHLLRRDGRIRLTEPEFGKLAVAFGITIEELLFRVENPSRSGGKTQGEIRNSYMSTGRSTTRPTGYKIGNDATAERFRKGYADALAEIEAITMAGLGKSDDRERYDG